ncbi:MAG TPA: hypothetical protein VG605_22350 [Puia sp.]|jgi:hypothetical protein|nr:hypothetical protein [Puia sp.]
MNTQGLKKILIIAPHFPPSNLAAVHRSRLFAQHLPAFGWEPLVLTVDEAYYEEEPDPHLSGLLPAGLRIEKASAFRVTRPRLVGDIGLRAFFQLYRKAKQLIRHEAIDFLYIPIPSFYTALLGRWLRRSTGIAYGIDYIDPWVHRFPGSEKIFSRHWFSWKLSSFLEPIAIRKASLITGVAEGYYRGVQERNQALAKTALFGAMPYGGEAGDHEKVRQLGLKPYLFAHKPGKLQLVYAGAMLPKAYAPLEAMMKAIVSDRPLYQDLEIHFIGTGKAIHDPQGYNIKPLAEKYGLWNENIFEYPARIPYLDVLTHLDAASGIFILGSTEMHYTPSKVYQGVLSGKPIWALLHAQSTACTVIRATGAGVVLAFDGEAGVASITAELAQMYRRFKEFLGAFSPANVDYAAFDRFSAREVTRQLAGLLDRIVPGNMHQPGI